MLPRKVFPGCAIMHFLLPHPEACALAFYLEVFTISVEQFPDRLLVNILEISPAAITIKRNLDSSPMDLLDFRSPAFSNWNYLFCFA